MSFKSAVETSNNEKMRRTANGMRARATTASKVLDFFGKVGASRGKSLVKEFTAALVDNQELALRALLWSRDIREGAGERKIFRDLLVELEKSDPALAGRLMPKVIELGRWDDILVYQDPLNRRKVFEMIGEALRNEDGLCAKWMPRKGKVAAEIRNALGMSPKQYRKTLVRLTKVVETQMCAKEWDKINFSHVPSVASARYQKAFGRNAPENYSEYIRELQKPQSQRDPKVKINASAIFPHDVVKSVANGNSAVADEQWKALPNFVGDARILPMVDVSGSMGYLGSPDYGNSPQPINVAVALGLYLSEKNTSEFKDLFLTFSTSPKLVTLKGSLTQRMKQMCKSNWGMSTNLHAAFDEILNTAVRGNVSQMDMPEVLLILSDMQFNQCARYDDSAMKMIERKYRKAGYEIPKIVFWNLSPYGNDNTPVRYDQNGTALVSGFSPSIMKSVLANDLEEFTPYNVMLQTLNVDRYAY